MTRHAVGREAMRPVRRASLVLAFGLALTAPVAAQPVPPADSGSAGATRWEARNQLGASINNAGLQDVFEVGWQRPLGRSTHPLRSGAHVAAGVVNVITPSMTRLGGWVQVAPLSVVSVRVGAEPGAYFGTFHSLQSFQSYGDPFDTDTRNARGKGRAATGLRAYVTPAAQFRAGPFAFRSTADVEWWRAGVAGPLYYEPARDTLLRADGGWLVNATTVALLQRDGGGGGFTAGGVLHHLTRVADAPGNRIQRLGAIAMHEFGTPRLGVPHLRLTATAWRYLDDPSKHGEWGAAIAAGVRFVPGERRR